MIAGEIFRKTPKGQSEMEVKSDALSIRERRVLILVNGNRSAALIREQSQFDNIISILESLERQGFIDRQSMLSDSPQTGTDAATSVEP